MTKKRALVVGAGPGGLTAAMLLASHGVDVDVFEKQAQVGGRNGAFRLGPFTFDIGPTFLMMTYILEEMFAQSGRSLADRLELREVDPMYRLVFKGGRTFMPTRRDHAATRREIARVFPGNEQGYDRYLRREKEKVKRLVPCLQVPYASGRDFLAPRLIRALPYLDAHTDLFHYLGRYFADDDLKTAFTFQAKYLGMSPWECPATFSLISYLEHGGGIWHPIGGLHRISQEMAKVVEEEGGRIHLSAPVAEILVDGGRCSGLRLESGEVVRGDYVVVNADFAHAMTHLVDGRHLTKWTPAVLRRKKYSCSTFMLYLGVDRRYDIPHHNILFADDYRLNVDDIAVRHVLSADPSIYIQNASITDPTLAPEGQSAIYILVPVTNNNGHVDWPQALPAFRDKVLDLAEQRGGLSDLRRHIVAEKIMTPLSWEKELDVYNGATFNLAHNVGQMLLWRPHNEFEDFSDCYLVGGGTHPGSGLPTIYESGRIAAKLALAREGRALRRLERQRGLE